MPLKVVNLDSVVSMQFVIRWDTTVLQYHSIVNLNFSNLALSDFNTAHALDSGFVRVQWEGPSSQPPGSSAPDSSSIFRIRFKVVGTDTSSSLVQLTEILDFPPTYFEIVKVLADATNEDYLLPECPVRNGIVRVGYTVSAAEPGDLDLPLSLSPNPFLVEAQLNFELEETTDTQVFIADATGRIVFEKQFFQLSPGQHGMTIEKDRLGAPGVYFLTVKAGRKSFTQKFITF